MDDSNVAISASRAANGVRTIETSKAAFKILRTHVMVNLKD